MSISRDIPRGPFRAAGLGCPVRLPRYALGMRIGLFGGSFNPPHEGHRLASLIALSRLQLDCVWWLVTPGNPLKVNDLLPPQATRMEAARAMARHPRIVVTDLEANIGTRYTYDTLGWLKKRCPGVEFVWIMGADNLTHFHRWQRWREITELVSIAVIDRPGSTLRGINTLGGSWLARRRIDERDGKLLVGAARPGFVFLHGPRSDLSSTEIRRARSPENGNSL